MPFEAAVFVAVTILFLTTAGMIVVFASRKQAAKEDEMRRAASARGWKFEAKSERGHRVRRWSGTTNGVAWTAESLRNVSGHSKHQRRQYIGRWHGVWSPGINGAIVAVGVPKGKEPRPATTDGGSWIARVAQSAAGYAFDRAIDVYFGKEAGNEVDARAMHRLEAKIPGFVMMADNRDEGSRVLQQGLEAALAQATSDSGSALSDEKRPWILLRPHAISLARMEPFRDVNEVESFVRAGVALTRAFKFGRPSAA